MKNMQAQPNESRTPTLDSYRKAFKYIPTRPDIRRIIYRNKKIICVNLSAQPGAKVDVLTD